MNNENNEIIQNGQAPAPQVRNTVEQPVKEAHHTDAPILTDHIYMPMTLHVLLSLLTFGIYNYVWIYRMTKYIKEHGGDTNNMNPVWHLILCILVPPYKLYWVYHYSSQLSKMLGIDSAKEIAILQTIVTLFGMFSSIGLFFIPVIMMQYQLNQRYSMALLGSEEKKIHECGECKNLYDEEVAACPKCDAAFKAPWYTQKWFYIVYGIIGGLIKIFSWSVLMA